MYLIFTANKDMYVPKFIMFKVNSTNLNASEYFKVLNWLLYFPILAVIYLVPLILKIICLECKALLVSPYLHFSHLFRLLLLPASQHTLMPTGYGHLGLLCGLQTRTRDFAHSFCTLYSHDTLFTILLFFLTL